MGIFAYFGGQIEAGTVNQITSTSTNISAMLAPWIMAGLTIWVMAYAYAVIRGEAQDPINRFIWDLSKKSLVLYLAIGAGVFQSTIIADVEMATQQLTGAINAGAGGECAPGLSGNTGIYSALDCSFNKFNNASKNISDVFDKLIFIDVPDNILEKTKRLIEAAVPFLSVIIISWFMSIVAAIMYAVIFLEVVTVRIVLAIAFSLGPLFIAAFAFEPTKKYFEGWVSKVIYCIILQAMIILFIGVAFGVISGILGSMAEQIILAQNSMDFFSFAAAFPKTIMSVIITMLALAFIFTRLPGLAGELTGHNSQSSGALGMMALGVSYAMRRMPNNNDVKGGAMKGK